MKDVINRENLRFFKSKIIFPILIFLVCFITSLQAAEIPVPLPVDAVMISKQGPNLGPIKAVHKMYKSSLNKNKLAAFYKKEMLKAGWKEEESLTFIKDNDTAIIVINQYEDRMGKTGFMISTSRIPSEEEALAMQKKNPDKLNFMPIYPGSEQLYLWDFTNGVSAGYQTKSSIKEVDFFYKSGMLNYGWRLESQTPVKSQAVDCPECKKLKPAEQGQAKLAEFDKGTISHTSLTFRRGKNETCEIEIENVSFGKDVLPDKTNISVSYREHKPIKI